MQALDRVREGEDPLRRPLRAVGRRASRSTANRRDWFYFVNGIEADRSAAEVPAAAGRRRVVGLPLLARTRCSEPVVVGAFPQPFLQRLRRQASAAVVVSLDPARCGRSRGSARTPSVVGPDVRTARSDANVVVVQPVRRERRCSSRSRPDAGAPVRVHVRAATRSAAASTWPFRYRYEVGGEPGSRRRCCSPRSRPRRCSPTGSSRSPRSRVVLLLVCLRAPAAGAACTSSARSARASRSSC